MVIFIPDDKGSSEEDTADEGSAGEGSSEEDTVETSSTDSLVLGEDSLMSQCCITVQHATRISHVISGFLLSSTTKCFAFARDKVVEYAEFLSIEKQIQTFHIVKVFGRICNMSTFLYLEDDERNTRVRKDVAVLTTDAGKLIILKYQKLLDFDSKLLQKRKSEQKLFEKIVYPFCEPGYNAQFPGHFLTTDPRGCAILIGAILDKMIVFIKTKSEGDPLKNLSVFVIDYGGYVIYDMVGLKPKNKLFQFAILRSKYTENEDGVRDIDIFSCNHARKFEHQSEKLGNKANVLAPVEPIGILAVSRHSIVYKSLDSRNLHLRKEIKVLDNKDYFLLVTPFNKESHLAQSLKGKVCFIRVFIKKKEISVLCVDVLPVARSWCMLTLDETYLFLSSEISDHLLYCVNYGSLSEVEGENKPREKEDEPDKEDETINETEEDETVNETEDDSGVDKHVENEPKEDKSGEDKSGEDKSEEDESKEEESEEEESEEDKPEEEDEADEDETEDDESEADKSEEDKSKVDKSEEDKSKVDKPEEDETGDEPKVDEPEENEPEENETEDKPEENETEDKPEENEPEENEPEENKHEENEHEENKHEENEHEEDKPEEDEPKVDETEGDKPEGDESEEDESKESKPEEDESEKGKSKEDESEAGKSEEDQSEEDQSEEDQSEEDQSEEDQSEKDQSEKDQSEKDQSEKDQSEEDQSEEDQSEEDKPEENKPEEDNPEEDNPEENKPTEKQIFELVLMLPNFSPLFDFQVGDLVDKGFSQMYIVGGRSLHSQLRVLELGCKITRNEELHWRIVLMSDDEELNNRTAWICKWETGENLLAEEEVLLFVPGIKMTSIFILNCSKELKKDSSAEISSLEQRIPQYPFITDENTLCCVQLGKDILQIIPKKVILVRGKKIIWSQELTVSIEVCAVNKFNVALYSHDGYLQYILFDCEEIKEPLCCMHGSFLFPITLLAIGKVRGKHKSPLIAAVYSRNSKTYVQIYYFEFKYELDLETGTTQKRVTFNEVEGRRFEQKITSIEIMSIETSDDGYEQYLLVGLENGSLFKYKLSGYKCMFDDDFHYLDSTPIKMLRTVLHNQEAVIAMSKKKQFITCYYRGFFHLFPLISEFTYDYYVLFPEKEHCLLGYRNHRFDFISLPESGYLFAQSKFKLENTPCKIILDECWKKIIVLEREKVFSKKINDKKKGDLTLISEDGEDEPIEEMKSGWISLIEIIDPFDFKKKYSVPLEGNAYAMSVCTINSSPEGGFLIVGALLEFEELNRRGIPMALTYEISYGFTDAFERYSMKSSLNWLDKTVLDGQPTTICEYNGVILIAEGIYIGLYCLNNKRLELLSKKELVDKITSISTSLEYNLIIVGHVKYNVSIFRLSDCGEELDLVAEEHSVIPTTSVACLNENTFASVDNFGNFMMMTLESQQSKDLSEQLELEIQTKYNVGKIVKIHLEQLHEMARPCLLYMTYSGSIGVLLENTKSSEAFLLDLQKHMIANTVLCVGEHICDDEEEQSLIDGDLCLEYLTAPKDFRDAITSEMKRLPTFICDFLQHMKMIHYIWMD